jgi:hypothetical protein
MTALTDNVRSFVIKLSHNWLLAGIQERRCGAATDICPQCIESATVPHLYLGHSRTTWRDQFIAQLTEHLKETSTAADLRCNIVEGIHTNESGEPDPTTELGWFQVLKGYHNSGV